MLQPFLTFLALLLLDLIHIINILIIDPIFQLISYFTLNENKILSDYFKGKNVLITGASSGIGKELSIELYRLGANIVLCSRSMSNLQKCAEECVLICKDSAVINRNKILLLELDLEKFETISSSFSPKLKEMLFSNGLTGIDVLINNAGVSSRGLACDTKIDSLKSVMV